MGGKLSYYDSEVIRIAEPNLTLSLENNLSRKQDSGLAFLCEFFIASLPPCEHPDEIVGRSSVRLFLTLSEVIPHRSFVLLYRPL